MTVKNLGPLVSGYLEPEGRNWELAVFQSGKPVLDKELNFATDLANDQSRISMVRELPSGWLQRDLVNTSQPVGDVIIANTVANELRLPQGLVAHVNGWKILVSNTNANDSNRLDMGAAPVGAGIRRTDLVILEVWRKLIAPAPDTDGKSPAGRIWWYGNVKIDAADDLTLNFADDIQDATLAAESTKRIQIQYRLRVVQDVDLAGYPHGIDDPTLFANTVPPDALTPDGSASTFNYVNQSSNGDSGLWRAGDGVPTNGLGTVDGYVYAIPIMAVFRRNDAAFDRNTNHNGGVVYPGPSDRPDGLFTDIIDSRDALDLRFSVNPAGWNYPELLQKNFNWLLDNALRTELGSSSIGGGVDGSELFMADEIGVLPGDSVTTGDTPGANYTGSFDGIRRTFSDEPIVETVWLRYSPADFGYGAGWPATDFTINISPTQIQPELHPAYNWASHAPSDVSILHIEEGLSEANAGPSTTNILNYIISGLGAVPQGNISIRFPYGNAGPNLNNDIMLKAVIAYPSGVGMAKQITDDYGAASFAWNNPGSLPADYEGDETTTFDYAHRAVQYEYRTTTITKTVKVAFGMGNYRIDFNGATDVPLYERIESVSSILIDAAPYAGGITINNNGQYLRLDPATFNGGEVVEVDYKAIRPMQQVGAQITIYYETAPAQTVREGLLGSSLSIIPRWVSSELYAIVNGPGSLGEGYPFPVAAAQTGGIYPSSTGTFSGDHELRAGPRIVMHTFNADTGFARVFANVPMVADPQSLTLERAPGDLDIEGRSFFKEVPQPGYSPSAFGESLSDPVPHKVVLPVIGELVADGPFGKRGQLILVTFQRWALADSQNSVAFHSDLAQNFTSASVYRLKGNPLNGRSA